MGWNHQPVILQLLEIQACISVEKVVVDLYGIKAQRHKSENENKKVWIGDVATVGGYHLFVFVIYYGVDINLKSNIMIWSS